MAQEIKKDLGLERQFLFLEIWRLSDPISGFPHYPIVDRIKNVSILRCFNSPARGKDVRFEALKWKIKQEKEKEKKAKHYPFPALVPHFPTNLQGV